MDAKNTPLPRMDAAWFKPLIEEFRIRLVEQGYTNLTVEGYTNPARHFAVWLGGTQADLRKIDGESVGRFARHHCNCTGSESRVARVSSRYASKIGRFVAFLVERQLIAPLPQLTTRPVEPLIAAYQHWQRVHRGLSERTISRDGRLLTQLVTVLGSDPQAYNAAMLRDFVCVEAQRSSPGQLGTVLGTLRGYLRFLSASGLCRIGLDQAVPSVPHWRLSSLPRYLASDDVERVIASCGSLIRQPLRDHAILLLLARLGLRAEPCL